MFYHWFQQVIVVVCFRLLCFPSSTTCRRIGHHCGLSQSKPDECLTYRWATHSQHLPVTGMSITLLPWPEIMINLILISFSRSPSWQLYRPSRYQLHPLPRVFRKSDRWGGRCIEPTRWLLGDRIIELAREALTAELELGNRATCGGEGQACPGGEHWGTFICDWQQERLWWKEWRWVFGIY